MGVFKFKDFSVDDTHCGQKVCSDAVLFAVWAFRERPIKGPILDIGCGSGLLALFAAKFCPESTVTGIELSAEAVKDSVENFNRSPWSEKLSAAQCDFEAYQPRSPLEAIISNPPFFSTGEQAAGSRGKARHEGSLNYSAIARYAQRALSPSGSLFLLSPHDRSEHIIFECEISGLHLHRLAEVATAEGKAPIRTMFEFRRNSCPLTKESITVRNRDGKYTSQYLKIVGDVYDHLS